MSDCYACDGSGWTRKDEADTMGSACMVCQRPECPFCFQQMSVEELYDPPHLVYWLCGCTEKTMEEIFRRQK